jgi:hypothetical protein
MSYDPSIDKIDNNSNPNKGEEFPKEKLDECARMNVSDYNTLWKNG